MLQGVDGDVRGEVVDPVERHVPRRRVGLRRRDPDQQRTRQPGTGGDRDGGDVARAHPGRRQRPVHGRNHRLQVRPGGHLGHDAAEARVLVDRRGDLVGEQLHPARVVERDDADAGLVAGGLDPQDDRVTAAPSASCSVRAAGPVVVAAQADDREPLALVQGTGGVVVRADLQEHRRAQRVGGREQPAQERTADPAALVRGVDADRVDLGLGARRAADHGDAAVADQLPVDPGGQVGVARAQLLPERAPRSRARRRGRAPAPARRSGPRRPRAGPRSRLGGSHRRAPSSGADRLARPGCHGVGSAQVQRLERAGSRAGPQCVDRA